VQWGVESWLTRMGIPIARTPQNLANKKRILKIAVTRSLLGPHGSLIAQNDRQDKEIRFTRFLLIEKLVRTHYKYLNANINSFLPPLVESQPLKLIG
jgi:hypothetical protein